jgi:hypothetical protein
VRLEQLQYTKDTTTIVDGQGTTEAKIQTRAEELRDSN